MEGQGEREDRQAQLQCPYHSSKGQEVKCVFVEEVEVGAEAGLEVDQF